MKRICLYILGLASLFIAFVGAYMTNLGSFPKEHYPWVAAAAMCFMWIVKLVESNFHGREMAKFPKYFVVGVLSFFTLASIVDESGTFGQMENLATICCMYGGIKVMIYASLQDWMLEQ